MRRIAIIAVGLAALTLTACGDKETGQSVTGFTDAASLAGAVDKQTSSKQSARVKFEITGEDGGTGEGVIRTGTDKAADIKYDSPDGPGRTVVTGDAIYVSLSQSEQRDLEVDKPWMRATRGSDDPAAQMMTALADVMVDYLDVAKTAAKFKASGTITSTTSDQVDGRPTTHFKIETDLAKLIEAEPNKYVKARLQELKDAGATTMPNELWVDADNLPVRQVIHQPAGKETGALKATITFSDWGKPAAVTAPPAGEVVDASEISGS
ncbi:hypothetical protein EV193_110172 [Herbihabitans rhizosphaerae]|uniref:Lipoprotein LprG n=1 Tax=Herbihabitans rhizosphaerae TaxID=1872711 RepID=A0A4Q7KFN6_9PSEU|nr:hypothetical protein [Herbihabitans rhizosphaerae]RZS34022.1 hypothetical protein EV193_110172 [Herbihabitans rhizosphaerae]